MDNVTVMALRAIISGLRYSQRIGDADCKAIVDALDEAGTLAAGTMPGNAAGWLDKLAADIARDSFGPTHPIALEALRKSQTD